METTVADAAGVRTGRTLTAVFEREADARAAVEALGAAGLGSARTQVATTSASGGEAGFWERLFGFLLPDDEGGTYEEGLRRGHALLTVSGVAPAEEARVVELLEAAGAIDLDERAATWRDDGWTGGTAEAFAPGGTAGMTGPDVAPVPEDAGHQPGGTGGMTGYTPTAADLGAAPARGRRDPRLAGHRVRAYES